MGRQPEGWGALIIHPIRNDADYRAALKLAEAYFDAPGGARPSKRGGRTF